MRIVIATRNAGKLREIKSLLSGSGIECVSLSEFDVPPVAEIGETFEENARIKAVEASLRTGLAALADDSGIEVDALGGQPGVHSARWAGDDEANNRRLLAELRDVPDEKRGARYRCVCVFAQGDNVMFVTQGACEGRIAREPKGKGGFGYDPLFLVPPYRKTMAQLTLAQKNRISHRARAFREMKLHLRRWRRGTPRRDV